MNAITEIMPATQADSLALILPDDCPYPQWLATGRSLANQKRNIDWLIGDWLAFGRAHYPEQIEMALAELGEDPKRVKRIEATVRAFPSHMRDASLSFDHHAHVADMPRQEALPLIKAAHDAHWTARQMRVEAMLRKLDIGQNLPRDDDPAHDALLSLSRAWNRAPVTVRQEFADMIAESHLEVIDV
ncbi:hypothetical protein [Novosphingobium sp.]|uniref:hypothetical protein n=1 Tax=Novosphingobium sp. TaxID=1874826 RepID=UPI00286E9E43|nr:hypothetical protein [Novosphingobium sp.]